MDGLVEQVVKPEKNAKYYIKIILIILIALLIPATFIVVAEIIKLGYLIYIALFSLFFCIYGVWYFITSLRIEFEYALLSSTFKVDKIIAKRKRKKVLKVDVKRFSDMFRYDDKQMSKYRFTKVYNVGKKEFSDDNFVAIYDDEAKGRTAIIFSPKEELLEGMRPYLSREIIKKVFYNR